MTLYGRGPQCDVIVESRMLTQERIMVGLGEEFEEVVELMKDLRAVSCDIMTIGQYLQPTKSVYPWNAM